MTEEAGMDGAFGLQANWLQADILINTDSEEEAKSIWVAPAVSTLLKPGADP
jgi:di/tripeptidase